jgi:hypothetical protein
MNGTSSRVQAFVSIMLASLDTKLASGELGVVTLKPPPHFSDRDLYDAAEGVHAAGRICLYGLTKPPGKFSLPYVVFRICDEAGYIAYRNQQSRNWFWFVSAMMVVLTGLLCWGGIVFPNLSILSVGAVAVSWVAFFSSRRRESAWLANLTVPNTPVREFIPYGYW